MSIELLQPYENGGKFGLKDENNRIIVNPIFNKIHFNEDDSIPIIATLPDGRSFGFSYALDDLAKIETDDDSRKFMTLNGEVVGPKQYTPEETDLILSELNEKTKANLTKGAQGNAQL